MEFTGVLEDWTVIPIDAEGHVVLAGHIYGDLHASFVDGTAVLTSRVMLYEGDVAFTKSSVYRLGTPYDSKIEVDWNDVNKQKKIGE